MVNQKQVETQEQMLEKNVELLTEADLTRTNFDNKRQLFVRYFKQMDALTRDQMSQEATNRLLSRFQNSEKLDGAVYLLTSAFATERDWDSTQSFLNSILSASSNAEFFRELAIVLLEIADNEISDKSSRVPLAHTSLVLLTEMGLLLANRAGQSRLDNSGSARVVEYITTSLLARSNINSTAMRMSMLHYLARNPLNQQATQQLNRVISRFGQSLLEEMFVSFFENKRRETAAFYFLLEHLNLFLATSPALSEMSYTVLRHVMLKYPDDFPRFLATYDERVSHDASKMLPLTQHIALLIRTSVEVSQRELSDSLVSILYKHLSVFKDSHTPLFEQHVDLACGILSAEPSMRGKGTVLLEIVQNLRSVLLNDKEASKVVSLSAKFKKPKDFVVKYAKVGEEPSPLESMLLLATG